MALTRFLRARGRARSRILLLTLLTLTFITAIISTTVGYTQLAATQALRTMAEQPFSADSFLRIHTSVPDEPAEVEAQRQRTDALLDELGLDEGLQRSSNRFGPELALIPSAGTAVNLPADLGFVPVELPAPDAASPVDGSWQAFEDFEASSPGPVPAALPASVAASLKLSVGDTFSVEGAASAVQLKLTAVVGNSPGENRETAPLLAASQAIAAEGSTYAVAVPAGSLDRLTETPKIQWTLVLDPATVNATDLDSLAASLPRVKDRMLDDEAVNNGGVVATGGLATAMTTAAQATRAIEGIVPIALIILAALALTGIVRLAGLLAGTRRVEEQLIGARGASTGQRVAFAALEILPIAVVGAAVGWAVAVAAAPLLTRWTTSAALSWSGMAGAAVVTWWMPVAVLLVTVLIFAGLGFVQARRAGTPVTARERAGSFLLLALLVGLCVLSLFQFLLHGSALLDSGSGAGRVNVLAAPAPALLILLFAAVALLIVAAAARVVEKRTGNRPTLGPFLAARQVARRMSLFVLPVLVIAGTVGTGVFAAAFTQSAGSAQQTAAQLVNGTDVRMQDGGPNVLHRADELLNVQKFQDLKAAAAAEAVHRGNVRAGTEDVAVTAVPAASLPRLVSTDPDVFNPEEAAAKLATPAAPVPPALELTEQTSQIRFQLSTTGGRASVPTGPGTADPQYKATITAWLQRSDGRMVPVTAGTVNLSASGKEQLHSLAFSLPEDGSFTAIAAVDISVRSSGDPMDFTVQLTSIATDAGVGTGENRIDGEADLTMADGAFPESTARPLAEGAGAVLTGSYDNSAPMAARLIAPDLAEGPLPVLATSDLLTALDLSVGDDMPLRVGSATIPAVVVGTAQALPGSGAGFAVLVDRDAYAQAWLKYLPVPPRANEAWIAAEAGAEVNELADAVRDTAGPGATVTAAGATAASSFLAPATASLWLATVGALIIGAAALAASTAATAASRKPEVSVLRAVGVQARDQAAGRRRELASVGAGAIVLGVVIGIGAALLTVPALAASTLVNTAVTFAVPFGIAVVPALLVVLAQAVVLGVAVWLYGRTVYRQSIGAAWTEELR